jgi:hypothetical protein
MFELYKIRVVMASHGDTNVPFTTEAEGNLLQILPLVIAVAGCWGGHGGSLGDEMTRFY